MADECVPAVCMPHQVALNFANDHLRSLFQKSSGMEVCIAPHIHGREHPHSAVSMHPTGIYLYLVASEGHCDSTATMNIYHTILAELWIFLPFPSEVPSVPLTVIVK